MAAKEYLDKAGLKRLVELIKAEIGKSGGGGFGSSMHYIQKDWNIVSGGPEEYNIIQLSKFEREPKIGDLGITQNGILFKVGNIEGPIVSCELVCSIKGTDGKDGKSILYYDALWSTKLDGSPNSVAYLINDSYFSEKPNDGDLAISKDGVLFRIDKTNGKLYYIVSLKGTDGKDGKDGKDGTTPHIGENGNWWIGETDTGVAATPIPKVGFANGTFYVVMPNGTIREVSLAYSNYPAVNGVPVYNPNRTIMVENAVDDADAPNWGQVKNYVNDLSDNINTALEAILGV